MPIILTTPEINTNHIRLILKHKGHTSKCRHTHKAQQTGPWAPMHMQSSSSRQWAPQCWPHQRHTLTTEDTPTKSSRHVPELTIHTHSPIAIGYTHHTDDIRHTLTRPQQWVRDATVPTVLTASKTHSNHIRRTLNHRWHTLNHRHTHYENNPIAKGELRWTTSDAS